MGKKKRPHHSTDNPIARARAAIDSGFYLEAISLWQVLITERLEEYLNGVQGSEVRFSNLGKLLSKLDETLRGMKRSVPEEELYQYIEALHDWFGTCHTAIHGLAKYSDTGKDKWETAYQPLKRLARDGKKHFKQINTLAQEIIRQAKPSD